MTLVELICVVAIVSVLIAIGVMGLHGVRRFKAERQIHTITGELSDLRKRAMTRRSATQMLFQKDSYVVKWESEAKTVPYEEKLAFVEADTTDGRSKIVFTASGRPSNCGTITFRVGKEAYRVIVAPVSGRIRMEKIHEKD